MSHLAYRSHTETGSRSDVDVIFFGTHPHWSFALGPEANVWSRIPNVRAVMSATEPNGVPLHEQTVVIPLIEAHIAKCPRIGASLFPSPDALQILSDKANFSTYVTERGLTSHVPKTFSASAPQFPCVLKRLDLNSGRGVAIVRNAAELAALLHETPWVGHPYLLQEVIEGTADYVTHAVCRSGEILWHRSYRYELNACDPIQRPGNFGKTSRIDAKAEVLQVVSSLLEPIGYDGPLAVDYRFTTDGTLKILEVNPRFGGSLMWLENQEDLAGALSTIIENAYLTNVSVNSGGHADLPYCHETFEMRS